MQLFEKGENSAAGEFLLGLEWDQGWASQFQVVVVHLESTNSSVRGASEGGGDEAVEEPLHVIHAAEALAKLGAERLV